jgi:hypothetical protein
VISGAISDERAVTISSRRPPRRHDTTPHGVRDGPGHAPSLMPSLMPKSLNTPAATAVRLARVRSWPGQMRIELMTQATTTDQNSTVTEADDKSAFDFSVEAEMFPPRNRKYAGRQFRYKRFDQVADAIRFAVEALPPAVLSGVVIEAGDTRLDARRIRQLYDSSSYPLARDEKCSAAAT